jgi:YHS domain-containing protein
MAIEKDPVCGMECTSSKITSVYKGKTYYFCSESCKISFELDPEKYVAKISGTEEKNK